MEYKGMLNFTLRTLTKHYNFLKCPFETMAFYEFYKNVLLKRF